MTDTNANMDTSPDTEADTASGGPAEPRDDDHDTTGDTSATDEAATDDDGTPVENPAG